MPRETNRLLKQGHKCSGARNAVAEFVVRRQSPEVVRRVDVTGDKKGISSLVNFFKQTGRFSQLKRKRQ
jgi:hypothetical protein